VGKPEENERLLEAMKRAVAQGKENGILART
jgi:hypothetical protein